MDIVEREQITPAQAKSHWYYASKYRLLESQLNTLPLIKERVKIADIGCGSGLFLEMLADNKWASPERTLGVDPATKKWNLNIPVAKQLPEEKFDMFLLMDVLEHVPDDASLLNNCLDHASPNGYVFITVPAIPQIWSAHDKFLGHYRRYTIESLEKLIASTGRLTTIRSFYYFACILPIAIPYRLSRKHTTAGHSDLKPAGSLTNNILTKACAAELCLAPRNKILGLTAVALCQTNH